MGGLGALQSNCQRQYEGLPGAVSDPHTLLCWVCFFGAEPGHSAEFALNQVGSRKSNEKQLDVFPQGWIAFCDRCLHPKGLAWGFELWFQILVILQTSRWVGTSVLGSVNGSITQPGISRENRPLKLTDISMWSPLNEHSTRQCHCPSLLFSCPSRTNKETVGIRGVQGSCYRAVITRGMPRVRTWLWLMKSANSLHWIWKTFQWGK